MSKQKIVTVGITIDQEVADVLVAAAQREGLSVASLVRRAVYVQYADDLRAALEVMRLRIEAQGQEGASSE